MCVKWEECLLIKLHLIMDVRKTMMCEHLEVIFEKTKVKLSEGM
jgi:hypothetical protein